MEDRRDDEWATAMKFAQRHKVEATDVYQELRLNRMEEEVKELRAVDTKVQEEISNVKVSLAEKMGYGVLGGSLMTILVKAFEAFGGS